MNKMSTRKGIHSSSQYFDEEGRHRTLEVNLDDQSVMLTLDTSLVGGGEGLTANVMAYTRPVVPVRVEITPAT